MGVTIHSFEVENVKRVKAVELKPSPAGLTVIGGKNGAGKTTILDAITWALAGDRYKPSDAAREGSMTPPHIKVTLSNGLIAERKGKNSALTVTDPTGKRAGQALINEFISAFALDLPRFMAANGKEKADTLLQIIGIGPQLRVIDDDIARAYSKRTATGQLRDAKTAYAAELPEYPDAPSEEVKISELSVQLTEATRTNIKNAELRAELERVAAEEAALASRMMELEKRHSELEQAARNAIDVDAAPIEQMIADAESINAEVRANLTKEHATQEAEKLADDYNELSRYIENKRRERMNLLDGADLPLPELTVEEGELHYKGHAWDCMSGSEQLRVATAIVRRLNPACGFVLIDKLEQMDVDTLADFAEWLEKEKLQAIATRVSTGSECQIIIEDGAVAESDKPENTNWKKGVF